MKRIAFVAVMGIGLLAGAGVDHARHGNQGCCSHHKGVCGCDEKAHAVQCCDGTLRPTCGC